MADNVTNPCTNDSQVCVDGKKAEKSGLGASVWCFIVGVVMTALGMLAAWYLVVHINDFIEVPTFQFATVILGGIAIYTIFLMMALFRGFSISGKRGFWNVLRGWFVVTAAVMIFCFIRGKLAEKQLEEECENSKSQAPARNVRSTPDTW